MLIPREIKYKKRTYTINDYDDDYDYYTYVDKFREESIKVEIKTEDELRADLEDVSIYEFVDIPEMMRKYFDEASFVEDYIDDHWDEDVIGTYKYDDEQYYIKIVEVN